MPAMKKTLQLQLSPKEAFTPELCEETILLMAGIKPSPEVQVRILRRSVDGRSREVQVHLQVEIYENEEPPVRVPFPIDYPNVSS